jgi:lipase maturation factor 1
MAETAGYPQRAEALTARVFIRALGLVYLAAFGSLLVQVVGLIGEHGILPARAFLDAVRAAYGGQAYWLLPTIFWINVSDLALRIVCGAGVVCAVLLIAGRWSQIASIAAWGLYLSLVGVGQIFLSYQWDGLLLEAGALAILAPLWPAAIAWMYRWLLFRLLFLSGVVKLLSGDPTWRDLTALTYHFQTQPLPNVVAWYVHHLPRAALEAATVGTFVSELAVPCLFFWPRHARVVGAIATIAFQALIFITGNYTFFNVLTVALALWLLDDATLGRWLRVSRAPATDPPRRPVRLALSAALAVIGLLGVIDTAAVLRVNVPGPVQSIASLLEPLRLTSGYGLFAVMTTTRPEIVFEGSRDGQTWQEYEFPYKPGDLSRRPPWVAPHQPRLDWQMWFAALGNIEHDRWVLRFAERLLLGTPEVVALLQRNPFPDQPPTYVRALLYDYRFSDLATKRATGRWWERRLIGEYLSPVSIGRRLEVRP